jgi:RimJ/RimL family protein N-acetyltransferase
MTMDAHAPRGSPPPTIVTERLVLQGHTDADREASAVLWGDERVTRFIGIRPSSREAAWGRVLTYAGLWATLGFGYWALHERATGQFVGEVGLADFRRGLEPPFQGAPEIGWALVPAAWGRGLAREAAAAALAWREAHLPGERTVCLISAEHAASIRLARHLGFRAYARTTYRDVAVDLFERVHAPPSPRKPASGPVP